MGPRTTLVALPCVAVYDLNPDSGKAEESERGKAGDGETIAPSLGCPPKFVVFSWNYFFDGRRDSRQQTSRHSSLATLAFNHFDTQPPKKFIKLYFTRRDLR